MSKLRQCLMEVKQVQEAKVAEGRQARAVMRRSLLRCFWGTCLWVALRTVIEKAFVLQMTLPLLRLTIHQTGFGDAEAFRLHRQGIKAMIESRGGLDALGLDGMVKCSVLQ